MKPATKMIKVKTIDSKIPYITLSAECFSDEGFKPEDAVMVAIYKNTYSIC